MSLRRRATSLLRFLRVIEQRSGLDRRWQIAIAAAFLLVSASALAFGPVVRSVAMERAAARGLQLEIGGARPGWFAIHLEDTTLRPADVSAVTARLERVRVKLTPWLSLRAVEVEGGEVALQGSVDKVSEQLSAWRAARRGGAGEGTERLDSGPDVHVEGVSLRWTGLEAAGAAHRVEGIYVSRTSGGTRAGFGEAELASQWGSVRAKGAVVDLGQGRPTLRSAKVSEVVGRLVLPAPAANVKTPDPALDPPPSPAAARADKIDDTDRRRSPPQAKSAGSPAVSKLAADRWLGARVRQLWPERKRQLEALRAALGRVISDGADVDIENVQLEIARGQNLLNVGPAPLHLDRRGDTLSAAFTSAADEQGKRLTVTGRLPLLEAPIELSLDGGPISLHTLGVREGDFGLLGTDRTELTVATRLRLSMDGTLEVEASGRLHHLALSHPALAPEPLREMDVNWGGEATLDFGGRALSVRNGTLGLDNLQVQVAGSLEAVDEDLVLSLAVSVPEIHCQEMLEAAPAALLPQLDGLRLGGTFALHSSVDFDTRAPKEMRVEWNFDSKCKVLETPPAVDPQRFREPFQHFVLDAEGRATEILTGPTTDNWVPLSDITPNMETALIVCEDSRFFSHNGFDNKAIRDSIIDNLQAGHFVRGGSTLSMQLAKNLYLGREKTLSRKLQEAGLTLLLEERLSKEDILELYLNVVEFGPGIYGIRSAAAHYFNSHPGELSLAQALYLASVLPSPKANHFEPGGALRAHWAEHLRYLMRIAHKINRISDDELEAGLSERLVFGQARERSESDFLFDTPLFELSDG